MSADDLTMVEIVEGFPKSKKSNNTYLSNSDLEWQEERKRRGVKRLDFEVR